ncbi:MAG: sulfurtransferase TusA family protein [Chitinivibrionales bacterium]|nr:sulfurtransferase TusA family protein [Chitinivibrionales bacterium]
MATHTLDITKEHCPMTMVKVKLKLAQLEKGDMLDVLLAGDEPLNNVPRSAEESGHRIVSIVAENGNHHVVIEK